MKGKFMQQHLELTENYILFAIEAYRRAWMPCEKEKSRNCRAIFRQISNLNLKDHQSRKIFDVFVKDGKQLLGILREEEKQEIASAITIALAEE